MSAETYDARAAAVAASGWAYPVRILQWRNPAFWLYAFLVVNGAWVFYGLVRDGSRYPTASILGAVLLVLYTLPFVWFITRADRYEREPAKLAVLGFLCGGLAATWTMALPGNGAILSIYAKLFGVDFASTWGPPLTAPLVEETSKYAGLILLVLLARNHVRSAYDGLLLGAFVGLGFQALEDYSYIVNGVADNYGASQVADTVTIFALRAVTGLWSHALYTAIAGAGLGYFVGATSRSLGHRLAVAALAAAMVIHGSLDAVAAVGPVSIVFTVLAGTIGLVVAWRFADRRQRRWIGVLLEEEVGAGTVTAEELAVLQGRRKDRKAYLAAIRREGGKPAQRRAGHVLDAELELAARLAGTDAPSSPDVAAARAEVARVRALPLA